MATPKLQVVGKLGNDTPKVTADDNGKIIGVVDGAYALKALEVGEGISIDNATDKVTIALDSEKILQIVTEGLPLWEGGSY